jgi:hypothetical protein
MPGLKPDFFPAIAALKGRSSTWASGRVFHACLPSRLPDVPFRGLVPRFCIGRNLSAYLWRGAWVVESKSTHQTSQD